MLSPKDIKEIHYFKDLILIEKIKKGYDGRKKYKLVTKTLLDLIEYKNETIFVYPYFEGITLKDAKLTLEEYYKYGVKIAQEIMKLQKVSMDFKVNLDNYFKEDQKRIKNLWKNEEYQEKILYIFSKEEIGRAHV